MFYPSFKAIVALAVGLASPVFAQQYNQSLNSQTRVAYHGPNGMTVSWNTYQQIGYPTVLYGLSASALTQSASSTVSVTYNTSLTYNNHVVISGLLPDTIYYYMPTTLMASDNSTGPFTFKTAKAAGQTDPFSVALVIDMGTFGPMGLSATSPGVALQGQTTIASIVEQISDVDFLMHPGDIAYADTWLTEVNAGYINGSATYAQGYKAYEEILDDFYDQMTPITTKIPYMIGVGNHESNCDNGKNLALCQPGQTNFTGVINHFRMPSDVSPSGPGVGNFWYSYDYGMAHYIQIDTETDLGTYPNGTVINGPDTPAGGNNENSGPFAPTNAQINWLTNDLASVNRTLTPWVIVSGHRPWYSSGSMCTTCQAAFEHLFVEYDVDLYLAGHFHVYERMTPIGLGGVSDPNGLNNPSAPWYVVNGAAGHYNGIDSFGTIQPYSVVRYNGTYGWSKLDFHNCTHLTQSFIASSNNSVLDSATLYKAPGAQAGRCGLASPVSSSSSSAVATTSSATTSTAPASSSTVSTTSAVTSSGSSSTSSMSSSSSSQPTSNCYADNIDGQGRTFSGLSTTSSSMTNEYCEEYCSSNDFVYSGTEYSDECYCSNTAPSVSSTQCTMTCAGNASEICGGPYALSVAYNATLAAEQSASEGTFKAFGCYTDDYPTLRVLANASTTSASMTPQFCQSFCQINGYSIAGVEYSTECFCGNALQSDGNTYGTPAPSSDCNMACAGDNSQTCGGSNVLDVFSTKSTLVISTPPSFGAANANGQCASDYYPGNNYVRSLSGASTSSSSMTLETCHAFCVDYTYYGVEYSSQCYCGNDIASSAQVSSACNDPCAGNAAEICGGSYAMNIYTV